MLGWFGHTEEEEDWLVKKTMESDVKGEVERKTTNECVKRALNETGMYVE